MKPAVFIAWWLGLALFSGIAVYLLLQWPLVAAYQSWAWGSWLVFLLISLPVYFLGRAAARSTDKYSFIRFVMGSVAGKMFLAAGAVFLYKELAQPATKWFSLPFLLVYLCFTIFETILLMRLGKSQPIPESN